MTRIEQWDECDHHSSSVRSSGDGSGSEFNVFLVIQNRNIREWNESHQSIYCSAESATLLTIYEYDLCNLGFVFKAS